MCAVPFFVLAVLFSAAAAAEQLKPSCNSRIYCSGRLLHEVQMADLFADSKTFVDFKMRYTESEILEKFDKLLQDAKDKPTKDQLLNFVTENFEETSSLIDWKPTDLNSDPVFISRIQNADMKAFAKDLLSIWPKLARQVDPGVKANASFYSLIPLDNGFIIPGGRFRETYYWDTYWIINGLLVSEMHETARGMLENFISLIERFGFIPNGSRLYYLNRSQPPLFVPMVANYFRATENYKWLKKNIHYLDEELNYWINNKMVDVEGHMVARYMPESLGPRPESYREDFLTVASHPEADRQRMYTDIKGAAESGWDFSSRWFYQDNGDVGANLSTIYTRRTIPVDLNSFLYRGMKDLAELYRYVNSKKSEEWSRKASKIRAAINALLWNEDDKIWYDYDLYSKKHRKHFYPSNLAPLWAKAHNKADPNVCNHTLAYLTREGIFKYKGGTPTSTLHTGEQWDFPNAWAPLQDVMVRGLANTKVSACEKKAKELAELWIGANYKGFQSTDEMFEKYDAVTPGKYGGGGEYTVQAGFGWSNGVVLQFLNQFFVKR